MKIFQYTIDDATYFGEDSDNVDNVADEIASRLNISSSEVFVEEVEQVEEYYGTRYNSL